MNPCPSCHRHVRASELACPFCGAAIRSLEARPAGLLAVVMAGAFALAGCGGDPSGAEDEAGTTTSPGTADDSDTIADDTSASDTVGDDTVDTSADTIGDDTTTTTTTNDSADDWDDNGGSFYAGPDDSETWGSPYCDPWFQDCVEGEKCVPFDEIQAGSYTANKCVPVIGDGKPGDPCTSQGTLDAVDDCDETSACLFLHEVDGQLVGECKQFCTGLPNDPVCGEGEDCWIAGPINACLPTCDPLAPDCSDAAACGWDGNTAFSCLPEGASAAGEACTFGSPTCTAGNHCQPAEELPACEGDSCCTPFCQVGDPEGCADTPGTECVPFFSMGMVPPGFEPIGTCRVPQP